MFSEGGRDPEFSTCNYVILELVFIHICTWYAEIVQILMNLIPFIIIYFEAKIIYGSSCCENCIFDEICLLKQRIDLYHLVLRG